MLFLKMLAVVVLLWLGYLELFVPVRRERSNLLIVIEATIGLGSFAGGLTVLMTVLREVF